MPPSLLTTKLLIPPMRRELVSRVRLTERLHAGLRAARKLTLVSAPAGYGKTTLITEWLADLQSSADGASIQDCQSELGRRVAWLSLDASDDDPARFSHYLLAALQQIDPSIGRAAQAMLQMSQLPSPEAFLTSLINDLAATPGPFVLVLDDMHLIQAPPLMQLLAALLEHQLPRMHLVIITREDPPLSLARLRARGEITDIRQGDLRFTEAESADFLRQAMQLDLSPADITTLQGCTEGWIAGLKLAALSMRGSEDTRRFVAEFAGSDRYILDYLVEEVFRRQSPDMQDFLLKTSILDRLTAPLCDAVSGRSDSRDLLHALDHASLFITRLDRRGSDEARRWYRYHHLFRDLLRIQGEALDLAGLHRKAAAWFEQNAFLDEALEHVLAAQDWDSAERQMGSAAAGAINHGQFATLNRWLTALPEARLRSSPELAALKGWASLAQGQFAAAEAWTDLAEDLLQGDAPPVSRALVACLRIYAAQIKSDIPQVIALAQRALALLEEEDPHGLRGAALSNLASAQVAMGDIPAATRTLRELARLGQDQGHPISAVSALGNLAGLEHMQGKAQDAIVLGKQALDLCVDAQGYTLPLAGHAHLALGLVYFDLNELALAREHLVQGITLGQQLGPTTGAIQAAYTLARIQRLAGEMEAALATAASARRAASALNLPLADALVAAYEADFRLAAGDVAAAARWADEASLSPADTPVFMREAECLTYARLLLAQNRAADARTLLASLHSHAQNSGLYGMLPTVCVLQAETEQALGQKSQALACLGEAVRLAAAEGYRHAFLDRGPGVLALLSAVRHLAPAFVDSLLGDRATEQVQGKPTPLQPLVEPLSERELEVLRLVAEGLSNSEIAARLYISVGTVKTHVHNILGKLDADGRPRAIARARELRLV